MSVLVNPSATELSELGGVMTGTHGPYCMPGFAGPLSLKTMLQGRGVWSTEGRNVTVEPGRLLVVNQDQPYSFTIQGQQKVRTFCPFFPRQLVREAMRTRALGHAALLDRPCDPDAPIPGFAARFRSVSTPMAMALGRLWSALGVGDTEPAMFDVLDCLLDDFQRERRVVQAVSAARLSTREQLYRQVQRALEYAHANLGDALTVGTLARVAGMSAYHFHRTFSEVTGVTPARFVSGIRFERAHTLLSSTTLTVSEVCSDVGFASPGSFSSGFTRRFGLSPVLVRRNFAS